MKTAKLKVILKADEVIVAEVENPVLWQQVLGAINQAEDKNPSSISLPPQGQVHKFEDASVDTSIKRFAEMLEVTTDELQGALLPTKEHPYIELNVNNWEAFKKKTPSVGANAVNPIGFVGTALALWVKEAKIDVVVTQALALEILKQMGQEDRNPSRGIKNTKWLRNRARGEIIINPAEISKAKKIVRAFCKKKGAAEEI